MCAEDWALGIAGTSAVPLSSIRQPAREVGRAAAELLLAHLDRVGESAGSLENDEWQPQVREFQPQLVARRSTEVSTPRK